MSFQTGGTLEGSNVRKTARQTLTDDSTVIWDMNASCSAQVTLGASRNLQINNVVNGDNGTLVVIQGGSGSYTLTLPGGSLRNGGSFTLSTAVGSKDILSFYYDGTNYFWNLGKAYA
jgi:hypothetical protein